jgi:tripartite-type tricarboxylate transporter receptor subunit TctC
MEAIAIKAGTDLVHVPYTSSPQAITAVIRNDAQITCLPAISVTPHAATGAVKILAVSTAKRSPYLPDVPTLKESGIDVEADAWNALIAPGGTPQLIINKISKDVAEIIKQPAASEKLATQLMEPVGSTSDELRARMDGEIERWAPVIKAANIKLN